PHGHCETLCHRTYKIRGIAAWQRVAAVCLYFLKGLPEGWKKFPNKFQVFSNKTTEYYFPEADCRAPFL
ncbi:MAG TPA: hypothetical protein PKW57_02710, partial [Anaerolineaceae bacterium]|nr:hypothetical protein [Anaerolineaceae bacterium]